jgi:hypothetical protein
MFNTEDDIPDSLFEKALMLKSMVESLGTGGDMVETTYRSIRSEFVSDAALKPLLPSFIKVCRDSGGIWAHLKNVHEGSGAYAARRHYINNEFAELLDYLEGANASPSDLSVTVALQKYDAEGVNSAWERALSRRESDPKGAITAARTLLEEVCKHILEDSGIEGTEKWDLPKLYVETAKELELAPSQHTEEVFKRILGGCHSVVENLGSLRNKLSDAHGQGRRPVEPAPRHAALSVNLAGSMTMFLVETWQAKRD